MRVKKVNHENNLDEISSSKVSGSLALLYFLLGFHGGRQGSSPDRGQSPVEWGDFPSVRPFVRSHDWLGLRPGWLGLRPGWMAQRGGQTDKQMDG